MQVKTLKILIARVNKNSKKETLGKLFIFEEDKVKINKNYILIKMSVRFAFDHFSKEG